MAAQQELISAVRSMQANAQASLPIIPNNGNPNGAYNAPRVGQQLSRGKSTPNDFSWLEPSPAMLQLQDSMTRRQKYLDTTLNQIRQPPAPPVNVSMPFQQQPVRQFTPNIPTVPLPAMPQPAILPARGGGIVLPSTGMNTGIVPPTMPNTGVNVPLPRMV